MAASVPFIDIRETGTYLPAANQDEGCAVVADGLGFDMPYFGGTASALHVCSNGFIGFGPTDGTHYLNRSIPSPANPNNGLVAAFWDDLIDQTGSAVHYERTEIDGEPAVIVQWTGMRIWGTFGRLTVQAQIRASGRIAVAFLETLSELHPDDYVGSDATIGFEAPGGIDGVQVSYGEPVAFPGLGLELRPR